MKQTMKHTLRKILRRAPAWSNLKQLGGNRVIRSSYYWFIFVPVIARIFSSISETLTITLFGAHWDLNLQLPFNWQMFFYSSCAFASASLIFQIYCPQSIQKYDSFSDWSEKGKDADSLIVAMWALVCKKSYTWPFKTPILSFKRFIREYTDYGIKINDETITDEIPIKLLQANFKEGKLKSAYYKVYDRYNKIKAVHRALCAFLYGIGFILLLYIVIQNIYYVFSYTNNI